MNYEKKYKEALERARQFSEHPLQEDSSNIVEYIFPELRESENERTRKEIISFLQLPHKQFVGERKQEKWIAWLEKQGNKPQGKTYTFEGKSVLEAINEEKVDNANKVVVEPKFKVGDWITNGDYTWKIVEVKPLDYILQSQDGNIVDDTISHVDEQFHSFTIKDAKDGDVLADKYNNIGIFQECYGICWHSYIYLGCDGELRGFSIGGSHEQTDTHPATKEQRDTLMKVMADAGWEFDFEKKELKKISQRMVSAEAKEALYDKPA